MPTIFVAIGIIVVIPAVVITLLVVATRYASRKEAELFAKLFALRSNGLTTGGRYLTSDGHIQYDALEESN